MSCDARVTERRMAKGWTARLVLPPGLVGRSSGTTGDGMITKIGPELSPSMRLCCNRKEIAPLSTRAYAKLTGVDRYFCFWNFFSRPISCSSVKMVRLRRGFFRRVAPCSVSDSLLMLRGVRLGEGSEPRGCCGESRCGGTPTGDGVWGRWRGRLGGCRVITESRGTDRSSKTPESIKSSTCLEPSWEGRRPGGSIMGIAVFLRPPLVAADFCDTVAH
ncbi:hypothetical protein EYF80_006012 [Liparis tanakae]|uniref:Uncharacterized protein n=1 Tax=Liparis tanakae TaxID=230148 RepID=A0A4Z2J0Z6_9TELE|nr:hypothetical protein EYF80_006012 [Liparis tanakae]